MQYAKSESAPDSKSRARYPFPFTIWSESGCAYVVERLLRSQAPVGTCDSGGRRPLRLFTLEEKTGRDSGYGQKADT